MPSSGCRRSVRSASTSCSSRVVEVARNPRSPRSTSPSCRSISARSPDSSIHRSCTAGPMRASSKSTKCGPSRRSTARCRRGSRRAAADAATSPARSYAAAHAVERLRRDAAYQASRRSGGMKSCASRQSRGSLAERLARRARDGARNGCARADRVDAADEAADPFAACRGSSSSGARPPRLRDRPRSGSPRDACSVRPSQRERRHHRHLARRPAPRRTRAPRGSARRSSARAGRTWPPRGGAVVAPHLVDAVLVAVQRQQPAVAAQADALERVEHDVGHEPRVGMGFAHRRILRERALTPSSVGIFPARAEAAW